MLTHASSWPNVQPNYCQSDEGALERPFFEPYELSYRDSDHYHAYSCTYCTHCNPHCDTHDRSDHHTHDHTHDWPDRDANHDYTHRSRAHCNISGAD